MVSAARPIAFLAVHDGGAAGLEVLGLTVLNRNIRQLERSGFDVQVGGDASGAAVTLRGDCQYPNAFFRALAKDPAAKPAFVLDVAELLNGDRVAALKILERALFDEILAGTGGVIARAINKKISFRLTRLLVRTTLTPNFITVVNFFMGAVGCLLLASPSWAWRAFGASLVQANSVLDGCDGEIAALKIQFSRAGAWLDTIADDVLNNLMLAAVCVGLYNESPSPIFLYVSVGTVSASMGVSVFLYHYLVTHDTQNAAHYRLSWDKGEPSAAGGKSWFDVLKVLLKRDCFIFIGFVLVLFDLRYVLVGLFLPVWIAFFLYLASFLYSFYLARRASV